MYLYSKYCEENNMSRDFDEKAYLVAHSDIKNCVELGYFKSGYEHYNNFGYKEGRISFPDGIYLELEELSKYEHSLFPCFDLFESYKYYNPVKSNNTTIFTQKIFFELKKILLTKTIFKKFDTVVIAPWVRRGGADLALLFHLEYLQNQSKKVLLILTENTIKNEWQNRIPKSINILDLGKNSSFIAENEKTIMLFHILSIIKFKNLHNINSATAWNVIESYGEELKQRMINIYVSIYCYDYSKEGKPLGYPNRLTSTEQFIDFIYSDNEYFIDHLNDHFGISKSKMLELYHPINEFYRLSNLNIYNPESKNVLWASRLDRQKRPDILFEIAKKCPNFNFFIFGEVLLEKTIEIQELNKLTNVRLMGSFDGFASLNVDNYFCFLYTSQWDGLPNILLEAAASGLPIISPRIGGITKFLNDDRGFLVDNVVSIDEYVEILNHLKLNPLLGVDSASRMKIYLNHNHTFDFFQNQLSNSNY